MSITVLKIIALVTMIVDHAAVLFFDGNMIMRTIGRIAFPLYITAFAEGYIHTRDRNKYFKRVFLLAVISELFYHFAFWEVTYLANTRNVIFSFVIAFTAIAISDKLALQEDNKKLVMYDKVMIYLTAMISGAFLSVDYGYIGVAAIITGVEMARNPKFKDSKLRYIVPICIEAISSIQVEILTPLIIGHVVALIIVMFYNGQPGLFWKNKMLKWSLFISYPLHLAILGVINICV